MLLGTLGVEAVMDGRQQRRLVRQFSAIGCASPTIGAGIVMVRDRCSIFLRLPLAIILMIGGLLAILPFLTVWMIPIGVLLLATDLPFLRPIVSMIIIRLRRSLMNFRRRWWGSTPVRKRDTL